MKTVGELRFIIASTTPRSAWGKGVRAYALDLMADMDSTAVIDGSPADKKLLLNGADSWAQYSEGGCALIYDGDIAFRVCNPSELKASRRGERNPNKRESWLDVQARALGQAAHLITRTAR